MHSYAVTLFLKGRVFRAYTIEARDMEHATALVMAKGRYTFTIQS